MKLKFLIPALIFHFIGIAQTAQQTAKAFVEDIMQERYDMALNYADTTFLQKVTPAMLEQIRNGLTQKLGNFKNIIDINQEPYKDLQINILYSKFEKDSLDLKVITNKDLKVSGFFVAPHKEVYNQAANPNAYNIQSGNLSLPGTLLIPQENNKHKLVILVHGSGPNDRDETLAQLKPFKDLADGLYKEGVASYRYDKRSFVSAGSLPQNPTVDDIVTNDVLNIIEHFYNNDTFRNYKLYIIGHSLGAMMAPRIAKDANGKLSGLIMMAAPARPLSELILEQTTYLDSLYPSKEQDKALKLITKQVDFMNSAHFNENSPADSLPLHQPASYWISFMEYNQVKTIEKLKTPFLILQGEKDYQVKMTDFNLWKNATKGMANISLKSYPGLSHMFMLSQGTPGLQDYEGEKHIPDYVISDIAGWIKHH